MTKLAHQVFFSLLNEAGAPLPKTEYMFHPTRRWRFDYCWPKERLAVEVEGGAFVRGRHTRGKGFVQDMEKYNEATLLGYRILRYTPKGLLTRHAVDEIAMLLKEANRG